MPAVVLPELSALLQHVLSVFQLAAQHSAERRRNAAKAARGGGVAAAASSSPCAAASSNATAVASDDDVQSAFWSSEVPAVSLSDYARRLVAFSGYGEDGILMALVLVARVAVAGRGVEAAPLDPLTVHRLLLAGTAVAFKANEDFYYRNEYMCRVGGVTIEDMNDLESAMLDALHFSVLVSPADVHRLCSVAVAAAESRDPAACAAALEAHAVPVPPGLGASLPSLR